MVGVFCSPFFAEAWNEEKREPWSQKEKEDQSFQNKFWDENGSVGVSAFEFYRKYKNGEKDIKELGATLVILVIKAGAISTNHL